MPTTTTSAVRQLSDGNGLNGGPGNQLGQSAADLVGFFGATPIAQPSGAAEAAITRGQAAGSVMTFSSSQSPSGVTALSTAEYSITVQNGTGGTISPATGDVWIVNKPTAQAGIGVGNIRQSAANVVGLSFQNFTGTMITPTASQAYGFVGLRAVGQVTAVLTPAAVAASTTAEQLFTVAGMATGNALIVSKPTTNVGLDIAGCRIAANNQVGITFVNVTSGVLTPTAAETYSFFQTGGLDSDSNLITLGLNATLTPATLTAAQAASITLSSSNIQVNDTFMGVQKPTAQVTVAVAGGFVSGAGVVKVQAINPTLTVATPTASEIYQVTLNRISAAAPAVVYSQTLTPTSVAANTTAEQTFVVTGVVAGSVVTVNKPTTQAGLGIVGARVSSANNIAITFCNATATTITPAVETYLVANWQALIDVTTGNSIMQNAYTADTGASILSNANRSAMVSLGLMAGA